MKTFFYRSAVAKLRSARALPLATMSLPHPTFSYRRCLLNAVSFGGEKPESSKPVTDFYSCRYFHSSQDNALMVSDAEPRPEDEEVTDETMNEFLSRFVHKIRGNLVEVYPYYDKETIDAMLLVICQKVVSELERGTDGEMLDASLKYQSLDLSQDLWNTIWQVSQEVLEDMRKEMRKEQMKRLLQSDDVKEMSRFASDIGIRGDMLRELRFKWAREKLEESEFYQSLELRRQEILQQEKGVEEKGAEGADVRGDDSKQKVVTLPQRRGKIKYKIYGLDLSSSKWEEVADRIHEAERYIAPEEPKEITGKCKLVTQKIFNLKEEDDPSPLLVEWAELLKPAKVDWLALLDRLRDCNPSVYFKVAEIVLDEKSFEANCSDYTRLIDHYAKESDVDNAERILRKMTETGINPDVTTSTVLFHLYSKTNNLDRAKNAFEHLRSQGIRPDIGIYTSMIMAYVNGGDPKSGEHLMREMEGRGIAPTKEIYMELLRAFAQLGHIDGARRMFTSMNFAGFQTSLEMYALLLEVYGHKGDSDLARSTFDEMRKQGGHKPDDRCTASVMAAYEKNNALDKALGLLIELEKEGFKPGIATNAVMVDWLVKLQLFDEAEQLLGKMGESGEVKLRLQISLCDMYARLGLEKKALEALRIVESKKELLKATDYERIIRGFLAGGLEQEAVKVHDQMQKEGFPSSESLNVSIMAVCAKPSTAPRTAPIGAGRQEPFQRLKSK
ncbi:hypothetical protein H6P81_008205 [Aristolochia fimbriata]|uniref:Pentatricopeptide repeat-containing protein n=1 Tax=Aristolochia fimbriata TaxID=158543 RepID=A0AAV7F3M1_ARIFI|nr:hypothetical protein H6P81_008205 [Aristolochia fimbriata]